MVVMRPKNKLKPFVDINRQILSTNTYKAAVVHIV